jgi:hypothetical protein
MRTTVRLSEGLLRETKAEAARRGETVTALIERGLRLVLASSGKPVRRPRIVLPVWPPKGSKVKGMGTLPGVDLNDSAGLLDIMEGVGDSPGRERAAVRLPTRRRSSR